MKQLKQILTTVLLLVFGTADSFAQEYEEGDNLLNLGIGIGGGFGTPIGVSFEHGFTEKISGGAYVGYAGKTEDLGFGGNKWKYTYLLVAGRASYHFDLGVDNLDIYAGVILGYNIASAKWEGTGNAPAAVSAGGVVYGAHAGARYWFSSKIGGFAEVGYGLGSINAGLAFKL